MSTRSRIGILNEDGTVTSVYCHSDGYISGVGNMLYKYYNDEKRIRDLLALGDLSTLGVDPVDCPELWDTNYEGGWWEGYNYGIRSALECRTYKGRGEKNVDAMKHGSIEDYINYDRVMIEFAYLYKDGKWYVSDDYSCLCSFETMIKNEERRK